MAPSPSLRMRLIGRFLLTRADQGGEALRLSTRKSGALLAYLAMRPEQTASREELAALLWGSCSDQLARQSLRQALALLRKELGGPSFFIADTQVVHLQPGGWQVDALEFENLSLSSEPADLDRALLLFSGDFLLGINIDEEGFDEWLRGQRQRLQMVASRLCEVCASHPELVLDGQHAIAAVECLLALDPLREDVQRFALTLYARYRGKHEALANAAAFANVLQEELDVRSEPATRDLVERIRTDGIPHTPAQAAVPGPLPGKGGFRPADHPTSGTPLLPLRSGQHEPLARTRWSPVWYRSRPFAFVAAIAALLAFGIALAGFFGPAFKSAHEKNEAAAPFVVAANAPVNPRLPLPPTGRWKDAGVREKPTIPILILPFAALGEASETTQLVADIITDDLTNILSRVAIFSVISRSTARLYAGKPVDVAAVGAELQVNYILEGSVRTNGDRVHVNVELIEPATRLPVWSDRIDRDQGNRAGIEDEIIDRLARELQFEILPIENRRRSKDQSVDATAYRGWAAMVGIDLAGYTRAKQLFLEALERDPQNLLALVGLGAYEARMGAQALDAEPMKHRARAREILERAIQDDGHSSDAYFYLGLALNKAPTLPQAMDAFKRAIEINPSNASAHAQVGNGLARSGQPRDGLEHVRYAIRLSPRDPIMEAWLEFAGNAELELKDDAAAAADFKRSIALNPGYARSWAGLAAVSALGGDLDEAMGYVKKLQALLPMLSDDELLDQFGRAADSRIHDGLRKALAIDDAPKTP